MGKCRLWVNVALGPMRHLPMMGICRHGYMSHGYMSPNRQDMLIISEILALKAGKTAKTNKKIC